MLDLKSSLTPCQYQVELDTALYLKENAVMQTTTRYLWEYSATQTAWNTMQVELKVLHSEMQHAVDTDATVSLAKLMNIPLDYLSIKLDNYGIPVQISNKAEILAKWEKVKARFLSEMKPDEALQKVLLKCDSDFANVESTLLSSLLYFLFFSPVYYKHTDPVKRSFWFPSVLNHGASLQNRVTQELATRNPEAAVYTQTCRHTNYGDGDLAGKYKKDLGAYLDAPFDYQFSLDAKNIYSRRDGMLQSVVATIREAASRQYVYENRVSISLTQSNP